MFARILSLFNRRANACVSTSSADLLPHHAAASETDQNNAFIKLVTATCTPSTRVTCQEGG